MKAGSEFHAGIVGLGSMEMGATLSRVRAGLSTQGANLNSSACVTLKETGAYGASDNAATLAKKLDVLLAPVVNATQVKQVLFDEKGVAQRLKPGTVVMISSTIASIDAQEIATALVGFDLGMLDAPVSDGTVKAANGKMTVVASGSDIVFERLASVLGTVAGKIYRIGSEPGLGSTIKIIRQLLAGVHIAAGARAMAPVACAGVPPDVMYDVVTNTARNSWMFENRIRHVMDGDYTPRSAIDTFVKDLGLVTDVAKTLHFPLPLASIALNMFTSASNVGYRKGNNNAVIKIFSDITLPGAKS